MQRSLVCVVLALGLLFVVACDDGKKTDTGDSACGNNKIETGELCDGSALGSATCVVLGFGAGTLACKTDCSAFDTSLCGASATCGDNIKNGTDLCDGTDLGGKSCQTEGFASGTLTCLANCTGFNTAACAGQIVCGNNTVEGVEVCDGTQLNDQTCQTQGFGPGTLACKSDCSGYDTTGCGEECQPDCGTRVCGPDPVCNESCGDCGAFEECTDAGQCLKTCDLDEITADTVVNIDLFTATVSGQIKLNNAVMPDNTLNEYNDRGWVRFVHKKSGATLSFSIGMTGIAQFSGAVFEGAYDIIYDPNSADYQNVTPTTRYVLAEDVAITGAWQQNYNLPTVAVSGAVTLNGAAMPANTLSEYNDRASIRFTDNKSGDSFSVPLGITGPAAFSTTLFGGDYKVMLAPNSRDYQNVLPATDLLLSSGENITATKALSYDVGTLTVSGVVELNAAQMPPNTLSEYNDRASIRFTDTLSGSSASYPLGITGPAAYSGELFKGTYRVTIVPNGADYQNVLPYLQHELEAGLSLAADTTRDFDVATAEVTGVITLDGAQMPANTLNEYNDRGGVRFTDSVTGDRISFPLGITGIAQYTAKIFTGIYKVELVPNGVDYQNVLPDMDKKLDDALAVTGDLTKHYPVDTVSLTATVTLNGMQMPANTLNEYNDRGHLRFGNTASGDSLSFPLGISGAATASVTVWKDDYQIALVPSGVDYQNVMPDLKYILEKRLSLTGAAPLSWDVKTATVSGTVTLNGLPMPANTLNEYNDRGWLRFISKRSYDYLSTTFGITGAATYALELWTGPYDVSLDPNSADYQNVLPALEIPLKTGCYELGADCTIDKADVSGVWEIIAEDVNWGTWIFTFTQEGDAVTGNGSNNFGQTAAVQGGTRSGDTITFTMQPYGKIAVEGKLINGCAMTGTFEDLSYGQGIIKWVGERIQ
ncbi:MAG TPA: hypothetical protein PLV42_10535 [bacterium]|nr:hypothetical protein [bacterium]